MTMNFLKHLLYLIANPVKGWEQIAKYSVPKEIFQAKLFFPIIGVLAVTSFVQFFYNQDESLAYYLQYSIIKIAQFYFGYIISAYLLQNIYSKFFTEQDDQNRLHIFVLYNITVLMGISIVENFFPPNMIDIFNVLPLYVVFIIWKGYSFMNINIPEPRFIIIFTLAIMVPNMILNSFFKLIL